MQDWYWAFQPFLYPREKEKKNRKENDKEHTEQ